MWEEQKTETETKPKGFSASPFKSQISCLDRGPVLWCFIIQKISVNELFDKNLSFVHEMSDCLWKFPFLLHFLLSFEEIELFQIKYEINHHQTSFMFKQDRRYSDPKACIGSNQDLLHLVLFQVWKSQKWGDLTRKKEK